MTNDLWRCRPVDPAQIRDVQSALVEAEADADILCRVIAGLNQLDGPAPGA